MKDFFRAIFEYHHHFNQKLAEQLIENERVLPKKTLPLFSHTINAQQIWNARIRNKEKLGVHQVHTLQECKRIDDDNFNETLKILDRFELDEKVSYSNSKGTTFTNSIQEILFHVANHSTHHKGQMIADLRESGVEPIVTDYIFYKRMN